MKQAKVLEIIGANEWEWPYGKLYYINMKLDNWETISLGKKKSDAFKVGDMVCYEDYVDAKWKTKQKEVKEENTFEPKSNFDGWNNWAMIWMSIKVAFETFYDPKKENFNETIALAHRIYEEAMNMLNEGEEPKESAKEDKLPF